MKICLVAEGLLGPGGVARSARRVTRALRAAGHDVLAVTPDEALFPDETRAGAAPAPAPDASPPPPLGAGAGGTGGDDAPFPLLRFGPPSARHPETWGPALARALGATRRDVVLGFHASRAGAGAVAAARLAGVPSVLACRGNDIDRDALRPPTRHGVLRALVEATAVTAVSREMARKVTRLTGRRATFVSNSVDPARFYPDPAAGLALRRHLGLSPQGEPGARPVLGLFGELKPKRGVASFVATTSPALAAGGWEVVVFGRARPSVARDVPAAWRRVPWLTSDAQLRAAYAACDAVAQPSLRDGMPNVVLEAMACERPVLASPVGGLGDLIDDGRTGLLCWDEGAWRGALEAVARAPEEAARTLGRAARAAVPRPEDEAATFLRVLARAVAP